MGSQPTPSDAGMGPTGGWGLIEKMRPRPGLEGDRPALGVQGASATWQLQAPTGGSCGLSEGCYPVARRGSGLHPGKAGHTPPAAAALPARALELPGLPSLSETQ